MATIEVLVKDPGKAPVIQKVENTLEALQELIGGNIETVTIPETNIVMLVDEEGRIKGLPANFEHYLLKQTIVGRAVFTGCKGCDFSDFPKKNRFEFMEVLPLLDPVHWGNRKEG
ncbi:MAG: DUF3846 domain-containing protein [Solobacterium sp.]|nr:DUF3846 domain-containing protein [Solobacterium sp.]